MLGEPFTHVGMLVGGMLSIERTDDRKVRRVNIEAMKFLEFLGILRVGRELEVPDAVRCELAKHALHSVSGRSNGWFRPAAARAPDRRPAVRPRPAAAVFRACASKLRRILVCGRYWLRREKD